MTLDRISIEVTNRCAKACWFCYERTGGVTKNPPSTRRQSERKSPGFQGEFAARPGARQRESDRAT